MFPLIATFLAGIRSRRCSIGWVSGLSIRPSSQSRSLSSHGARAEDTIDPSNFALRLEDIKVGDVFDGTVAKRVKHGVIVDIGCPAAVHLACPKHELPKLKLGDQLHGLVVEDVDSIREEVALSFPGLSEFVAGREVKSLEDFAEGDVVDGTVVGFMEKGVFLDIGCERDAFLMATGGVTDAGQRYVFELRKGEAVKGLTIAKVDPYSNQLVVSLPLVDLHKIVAGRRKDLKEFKVGDMIDGKVITWNKRGVFIDVGCFKEALLQGPSDQVYNLNRGEELKGLEVMSVDAENHLFEVRFPALAELVDGRGLKLQDLKVGEMVDGRVARRDRLGVWIDIGCGGTLALLKGHPHQFVRRLWKNEEIKDLVITEASEQRPKRLAVHLPDLEAHVAGRLVLDKKEFQRPPRVDHLTPDELAQLDAERREAKRLRRLAAEDEVGSARMRRARAAKEEARRAELREEKRRQRAAVREAHLEQMEQQEA